MQVIACSYFDFIEREQSFALTLARLGCRKSVCQNVKVGSETYCSVICGDTRNDEHKVECYDELDHERLHV